MASGFLILTDGRCLARRWSVYDGVLLAIADQIEPSAEGLLFQRWLRSLVPGPLDKRHLDLRQLASKNQQLFVAAAERACDAASSQPGEHPYRESLMDLGDMLQRMKRGEPPLSRSDWTRVIPPDGRRVGPGWD